MATENKVIQKTLIQVWGKHNSGKSSTIKNVYREIKTKHANSIIGDSNTFDKGDIYSFITLKDGVKIGFSSMGDILRKELKLHLDMLFNECDIIIAASRIRNNVDTYLEQKCKEKKVRRIKVTNCITSTKTLQEPLNKLSANHIVDIIENIINETI
ncbi:hypothetical protein [Flavobacterium psychrotolerans]|uniref:G domain-containing protein n=1 Tax=Flavobacterium psychrotolerans TaxID=2169410 RepID=A0A2U1JG22_9FLAO|nr:hypothetical protein [Flavobacterium psychrotolerans]PWA03949.1 hypothetical protein DB895_13480 [Flavobacterium psychrotolerans]